MTVGKNAPKGMVAIFDPSPVPNQTTKSGNNAIFGIGKIAETRGKRPARTSENSPIAKPTAMPSAVPNVQPTASRSRLAPRCFHSAPVRTRSISAASACEGAGNAIGLITPYPLPSCHSAISVIKTSGPTMAIVRRRNPLPRNGTGRVAHSGPAATGAMSFGAASGGIGQLTLGLPGVLAHDRPDLALEPLQLDPAFGALGERHVDFE